jgi:hypothetical protein
VGEWVGASRQRIGDLAVTLPRSYTAAEIAHIWRRPLGTVHRLASEHDWRRSTDRRRPVLYNADDVEATMNHDTPERPA